MAVKSCAAVLSGCFAALSLLGATATPGQWEQKVDDQGRKSQQMQIQAPAMTEEDQHGYVMPDRYRCDACRAVIHHLKEALTQRQPKSRRLHEWERQEIFEDTCKNGFKGYGIVFRNGENALSGPGLTQEKSEISPGMGAIQMGGESWERRLGEICRKLVFDDVGEDELYELFRAGKLTDEQCRTASRACQAPVSKKAGKKPAANSKTAPKKTHSKKAVDGVMDDVDRVMESVDGLLDTVDRVMGSVDSETVTDAVDGAMDAATFLASLAKQRGHANVTEFFGKHDRKRWEGLVLQAADWLLEETSTRGKRDATSASVEV